MDSGISNSEGQSSGRLSAITSGALMPQVMPVPNQFQLDRPRSGSPFFPAMGQFFDQRLGVSPAMLLPPKVTQGNSVGARADDTAASTTPRLIIPDGRSLLSNENHGVSTAPVGRGHPDSTPGAQIATVRLLIFEFCLFRNLLSNFLCSSRKVQHLPLLTTGGTG